MRALTAKEKRLLVGLLAAIFVLLNVLGLQAFIERQRALQKSIADLEVLAAESRDLVAQKNEWDERAAWLDANQPEDDTTTTDDDAKFYEFVESSAKKHGLQYTRKDGGTMPGEGPYAEVFDSSQVKGNMESLVKWLSELQQPEDFRAIKRLSIKSAPEPPDVICDIEVARWYRPAGGQPVP